VEFSTCLRRLTSSFIICFAIDGLLPMTALNDQAVKPKQVVGSIATTSAERGWSSITVISPKNCPFPSFASLLPSLLTSTLPSRMRRKARPRSPCCRIFLPASNDTSRPDSAIVSSSLSSSPAKRGTAASFDASRRLDSFSSSKIRDFFWNGVFGDSSGQDFSKGSFADNALGDV